MCIYIYIYHTYRFYSGGGRRREEGACPKGPPAQQPAEVLSERKCRCNSRQKSEANGNATAGRNQKQL